MALPSVPQRLGRYGIIDRLAVGGMAEILLGRVTGPSGFERPVVIKRILPHMAHSPEFCAMFLDEAKLVARIRHPNVVQVHELAETDGELFLVMEYLEGESLSGILRRLVARGESMPHALAAYVIAEACGGLHAAHELKDSDGYPLDLVHRDVSPQNIFVLYAGGVRVLDFGIAKATDRSSVTVAGELKGKFQYMSPEQCLSKPLDRRSDIFSLGVVLFELSTNRRLFKRENELMTFKAICELPVVRPSEVVADYPAALERIVLKALARRAKDRYQTAAEMRRDLLAAARELGAGDEPAEAVAQLMRETFADRIEEKAEMLRRVSAGSLPTHIPMSDADADVEVPNVTEWASSKRLPGDLGTEEIVPRRRGLSRTVAVVAALSALAGAAYLVLAQRSGPSAPVDTIRKDAPPTAPRAAASMPPAATVTNPAEPREVVLSIVSHPSGAKVLVDGEKRGSTPLTLKVKPSSTPLELTTELPGFKRARKTVVPDQARSFELALEPLPRRQPGPASTAKKPTDDVPLF
jgi:Protein kinase domain/PEGA domain